MGCTGWSADDCWPLIARLENNDGPGDHHGRAGPVKLRQIPPHDPCGVAVLAAAAAVGLPTVCFNEGATVTEGAGFFQINADEDNIRMSSSRGYLHPIMGRRRNLVVLTDAWVKQVLFDAPKRATGVEYLVSGRYATVHARREVILSAGAIDTPTLLMLSGIGPAEHLRDVGIDVLVDSPGVGSNLDDHVEGLVMWEASRPMVTRSTQWWEIGLFTRTEPGLDRPDLMMHYGSVPFDLNTVRWLPDHVQRLLPDTERHPRPLQGHGPAAVTRLPGPGEGRPPLLHRSAGPRHRSDARRDHARPPDRRAAGVAGLDRTRTGTRTGRGHRRRAHRLHPQDAQHRLPPRGHGQDGCCGRSGGRA